MLMVLFFGPLAFAQDSTAGAPLSGFPDSVWKVDSITILGNTRTKDFVILREMSLKPGMPITRRQLEYDQNRIYSLRLFNQVQLRVVPSGEGLARLIIEVSERWFLFPYPIFGIRDRDWSKIFYGAGVAHSNVRGRNEKLYASFILGYDPSVSLAYRNPALDDAASTFFEIRGGYTIQKNRSLEALSVNGSDFDERHLSFGMNIGKRIGIEHTLWLNAGYEVIHASVYEPGRTLSTDGTDRFPILGAGYAYDTRDLGEYPGEGTYVRAAVTKYGLSTEGVNVVRYALDVRRFIPLFPSAVLGFRGFTDLAAAGPTPTTNRVYFGYGERIRGHFRDVMEGEDIAGFTAEFHYTLLPPQYFTVGSLPAEFGVWRFGVVGALFGDAGQAWFRGEPVSLSLFARGYGAGLHFLLPYSTVLRVEYAWNELRRGEFIIDAGATL